MNGGLSSLFAVSIDFNQSHLFFPKITLAFLAVLLLAILATRRRAILASGPRLRRDIVEADWLRLVGTLVLTVVYFLLMPTVGQIYPNAGIGFYLTSIPYLFLLSYLYLHVRRGKPLLIAAISAVVSPTFAWYFLVQLFNLSLP
jgi:hypothetical protein